MVFSFFVKEKKKNDIKEPGQLLVEYVGGRFPLARLMLTHASNQLIHNRVFNS